MDKRREEALLPRLGLRGVAALQAFSSRASRLLPSRKASQDDARPATTMREEFLEEDLDRLVLRRGRSNSEPALPIWRDVRNRAITMTNAAVVDLLNRAPSFRFSLPFAGDSSKEVFDDNASLTSLELEARFEMRPENNRFRAIIEGLPAPSIPTIPGRLPASPPPFAGLSQATANLNIVVLGGYRGSVLRSTQDDRMLWVPVKAGLGLRKVNLELPLSADAEADARKTIYPDGMLTNIGPIDISRKLLKRLRDAASQGYCKVHEFGYDWRLGGAYLSSQFITFLESLQGPSLVVAHSMGGLITGHALNRRPDLFAGVIYGGTPWGGCPNILGPFRYGDSVLLNRTILSARTNFSMRSSFMLLPTHKRCFVDSATNKEIPVDLFDPEAWYAYGLSPMVASDGQAGVGEAEDLNGILATGGVTGPKAAPTNGQRNARIEKDKTDIPLSEARRYLEEILIAALQFKHELRHDPDIQYPPLAILRSEATPTVRGCKVNGKQGIADGDYTRFILSPGDGVVTYNAADIRMMEGGANYEVCADIATDRGHIGLFGDLKATEAAFMAILARIK
ncbi:hypothetical protein BCR37DRAFT_104595 [Protomyces lactucae-debilis]|uniref:Alpha/Beta hydrolase protein n=1 Tax=Protomyces lactucae-debilis TaxID=2754530 RepID=A0A1Y2F3P3_PROLT|nr:uncharacterized protein BCR37DRAFT_104595 [Protomyces lactucae-debilis]ORY78501.1 hypothetical protein BCR37DRAFT_104595 [Protomyces lactucae-debilis]